MTDEQLTAHCFLFFTAGLDVSCNAITLALYEIAANTNIQTKLQNEIEEYLREYDHTITYNMLNSMPYLNQVVSGNNGGSKKILILILSWRSTIDKFWTSSSKENGSGGAWSEVTFEKKRSFVNFE